jgi:hypothetical protein
MSTCASQLRRKPHGALRPDRSLEPLTTAPVTVGRHPVMTTNRRLVHIAPAALLTIMLVACDSRTPTASPESNAKQSTPALAPAAASITSAAGPMTGQKSFALATFCAATASSLKSTRAPGVAQGDLERVEARAKKYAIEEAATRGFSAPDVEKQVSAMVTFTAKKLTPADGSDSSRRKVELEAASLAAQVASQCVPAFGKLP